MPDHEEQPTRPARPLSRRLFLHGAGVMMALPWLESVPAWGAVTSDGFSALRGLVLAKAPAARRSRFGARSYAAGSSRSYGRSGRWTLFPGRVTPAKR